MATKVVDERRVEWRREDDGRSGDFVLYWMQRAQRTQDNHALELGIRLANSRGLPLVIVFCVVDDYPEATARHYQFMFEGLSDVESAAKRRGIHFEAIAGHPAEIVPALSNRAALIVTDRDHLRVGMTWRDEVHASTGTPFVEVETDLVVPLHMVSDKKETSARTIRPKILDRLDEMVEELATNSLDTTADAISLARTAGAPRIDLDAPQEELERLGVEPEPGRVDGWVGGQSHGYARLRRFIEDVLPDYANARNRYDQTNTSSELSPYLHFGHVSAMEAVRLAQAAAAPGEHLDAFVDELVVRRELAVNFVTQEPDYDSFGGLPDWARKTLEEHKNDQREHTFTAGELERGETHDEVWNAIMGVIRDGGWVHNQLRMYWGKQIIGWTNTPEHAFRTLLELNNRYFLDGRDANSYANVAWCFGLHDQGFKEREIIGKLRPFTEAALRRKGDLDSWVDGNGE